MDYPAINVSLDRSKQGELYTTKPGPYDLWAIEYGYTETDPAQEEAHAEQDRQPKQRSPSLPSEMTPTICGRRGGGGSIPGS